MEHNVILVNGISGVALARYFIKFSDKKITIISAETKYSYLERILNKIVRN